MNKFNLSSLTVVAIVLVGGYFVYSHKNSTETTFNQKQECAQYTDLANQKVKDSGRVFEKDSFTVNEIFYSPKKNTCLYAYTIHTTFDPKEIYSIDDLFGGGVFAGSIETDFYNKIAELKE